MGACAGVWGRGVRVRRRWVLQCRAMRMVGARRGSVSSR